MITPEEQLESSIFDTPHKIAILSMTVTAYIFPTFGFIRNFHDNDALIFIGKEISNIALSKSGILYVESKGIIYSSETLHSYKVAFNDNEKLIGCINNTLILSKNGKIFIDSIESKIEFNAEDTIIAYLEYIVLIRNELDLNYMVYFFDLNDKLLSTHKISAKNNIDTDAIENYTNHIVSSFCFKIVDQKLILSINNFLFYKNERYFRNVDLLTIAIEECTEILNSPIITLPPDMDDLEGVRNKMQQMGKYSILRKAIGFDTDKMIKNGILLFNSGNFKVINEIYRNMINEKKDDSITENNDSSLILSADDNSLILSAISIFLITDRMLLFDTKNSFLELFLNQGTKYVFKNSLKNNSRTFRNKYASDLEIFYSNVFSNNSDLSSKNPVVLAGRIFNLGLQNMKCKNNIENIYLILYKKTLELEDFSLQDHSFRISFDYGVISLTILIITNYFSDQTKIDLLRILRRQLLKIRRMGNIVIFEEFDRLTGDLIKMHHFGHDSLNFYKLCMALIIKGDIKNFDLEKLKKIFIIGFFFEENNIAGDYELDKFRTVINKLM